MNQHSSIVERDDSLFFIVRCKNQDTGEKNALYAVATREVPTERVELRKRLEDYPKTFVPNHALQLREAALAFLVLVFNL